jgi:hypothetical protein
MSHHDYSLGSPVVFESTQTSAERDPFHAFEDPVVALHEQFTASMPYLEGGARLQAVRYFEALADPLSGIDIEESELAFEDPQVVQRMLELYYGAEQLSNEQVMLRAIAETPGWGEEEAQWCSDMMTSFLEDDSAGHEPGVTLEDLYHDEINRALVRVLQVNEMPPRAESPTPAIAYQPRTRRYYNPVDRPLAIGDVEIAEPDDFHKLNIPELKEPWKPTVDRVLLALADGNHVILGTRRNSGKTHIFPQVLREHAPENWTISEMTNNNLRGGESAFGTTQKVFFRGVVRGENIEDLIAKEHSLLSGTTSPVRPAVTEHPERRVLIVDEAQAGVLDPAMVTAKVIPTLIAWAEAHNTQLVLISALGDQRSVAVVKDKIEESSQGYKTIQIEQDFDRPEYPLDVLESILRHTGVPPEVINWWVHDEVAAPLRTMRGVFSMYAMVLHPLSYDKVQGLQLQSVAEVGDLLTNSSRKKDLNYQSSDWPRLIDGLAATATGSGAQLTALAEYFGAVPPDYKRIYQDPEITVEDVV